MSITVWRSNRTEVLAEELARQLADAPPAPFERPVVVVHGRGVATWLQQYLADRLGICAQIEFLFPGKFVTRLFGAQAAASGGNSPRLQQREQWFWAALTELDDLAETEAPELEPLRRYLGQAVEAGAGAWQCGLARRIAQVFDQYAIFRPDWVTNWDRGGDVGPGGKPLPENQRWQAELWRRIVGPDHDHVAALVQRFEAWRRTDPSSFAAGVRAAFPERVFLFGLTSLPPSYLRAIANAAHAVPTGALLVSPSNQFWTDAPRRRKRKRGAVEDSNPLVEAFGLLGAEFAELWEGELAAAETAELEAGDEAAFVVTGGATVLGALQDDVLHLQHVAKDHEPPPQGSLFADDPWLGSLDGRVARSPIAPGDRSLTVHSCHGPTREIEVLRDQLLAWIDRGIEPHEIVVLLPDVEEYAPRIEAVFRGGAPDLGIPYRIADRPLDRADAVADVLLRLLPMVGARVAATDLIDLLGCAPVGRAFGIEGGRVDAARRLLQRSGVRWAFDAADRSRHGQPALREHTVEFGLDRLLLGYAQPSSVDELVAGVLPDPDVEGQTAVLVGRLARFCQTVKHGLRRLQAPRPLAQWRDDLLATLEPLCLRSGAEPSGETEAVRSVLDGLVRQAEVAEYERPLALDAMRSLLSVAFEAVGSERGFLDGGVTFCAMLPLRSVPFRVVAMCGLSDGVFPRASVGVDVDLLAKDARPGDRDRRKDDRYLFLEAILAARDGLVLTYSGKNVRNDRQLPPSVVLQELLDAIVDRFDPPSSVAGAPSAGRDVEAARREAVLDHVRTEHPLQSFAPAYFDARSPKLWSYDASACAGARGLLRPKVAVDRRLFAQPIAGHADGGAKRQSVELSELQRFWRQPIEALLRERFQLTWPRDEADLPRREPIDLDPLTSSQIGQRWLDWAFADGDERDQEARLRATGWVPPGRLAEGSMNAVGGRVRAMVDAVRELGPNEATAATPFAFDVGDRFELTGTLPGASTVGDGTIWAVARFVGQRGKHVIGPWIQHLVASVWTGGRGTTIFAGKDATVTFPELPATTAEATLAGLLELYEQGRARPLRFEPSTSLAFVEHQSSTYQARKKYADERRYFPGLDLVFGDDEPPFEHTPGCVAVAFEPLAECVFSAAFLDAWSARERRS